MSLVKTVGRILPVALSLAVLVACGDKKEEKPVPVKQPEPVKVEPKKVEPVNGQIDMFGALFAGAV